ncbi:MAG: glycine cleavage system protein GcvH [Chitinivibrionales bacterium]|nr:glycine cleavage system protein GcvH [Chitinivibrionales bacterium]
MSSPTDRKYAKSHEWIKIDGDSAVIGISDHAQDALGDITFVETPAKGTKLEKGKEFGVIESVKAASDLYSPVSCEVVEVNDALGDQPEMINNNPYDEGWILKVKNIDGSGLDDLMDSASYEKFLKTEE